jgi:hypothetical protein
VKLVESGQLPGREWLIFRSKGRQRRLQPPGEAGRAIVVAYAVKNIDHCSIPPKLRILSPDMGALPASDYPR